MPQTTEAEARALCIEAGYDPDFVGTKGYPNWQMHGGVDDATREANAEALLRTTRASILAASEPSPFYFGPDEISPERLETMRKALDSMRERAIEGPTLIPENVRITSAGNSPVETDDRSDPKD